jgi:rhamnose utilization protein RhaD (predicted bifunctional aldolase and dehydrogenase)
VKKAALSRLAECGEGIEADVESAQLHVVKNEMCPSIETAMHAILPQRVVLDVHSINTIVWAILLGGPGQLEERLDGLRSKWSDQLSL